MANWVLKTEPSTYSFEDLTHEKRTVWSGVKNPAALKNLQAMEKGDKLFIYHTGDEKAIVGTATVGKKAYVPEGESDTRLVVVDIIAGKRLAKTVTLGQIKGDKRFGDWALVKIGRLSVVPATNAEYDAVMALSTGS